MKIIILVLLLIPFHATYAEESLEKFSLLSVSAGAVLSYVPEFSYQATDGLYGGPEGYKVQGFSITIGNQTDFSTKVPFGVISEIDYIHSLNTTYNKDYVWGPDGELIGGFDRQDTSTVIQTLNLDLFAYVRTPLKKSVTLGFIMGFNSVTPFFSEGSKNITDGKLSATNFIIGPMIQSHPTQKGFTFRYFLGFNPIGVDFSDQSKAVTTSLHINRKGESMQWFLGAKLFMTVANSVTGQYYSEDIDEDVDIYFSHKMLHVFWGLKFNLL